MANRGAVAAEQCVVALCCSRTSAVSCFSVAGTIAGESQADQREKGHYFLFTHLCFVIHSFSDQIPAVHAFSSQAHPFFSQAAQLFAVFSVLKSTFFLCLFIFFVIFLSDGPHHGPPMRVQQWGQVCYK